MSSSRTEEVCLECYQCKEQLTDGVLCSACNKHLHYHCAGITEKGYRQLGSRKGMWRCFICKQSAALSLSPITDRCYDMIMKEIKSLGEKLTPLDFLVQEVKQLRSDLGELSASAKATENTIKEFSSRFSKIENRLKLVEDAKIDQANIQSQIDNIVRGLNDKEQWDRMNNVKLKGIPQNKNENLLDLVGAIGKKILYPISKSQINFATRVQTRDPDHVKPVIICFKNRYVKEDFVAAARAAAKVSPIMPTDLGLQGVKKIFVNDHLTLQNKTLLSKAKKLANEHGFRYVWVKNAKIFLRRDDSSPILNIRTVKDLSKIALKQ